MTDDKIKMLEDQYNRIAMGTVTPEFMVVNIPDVGLVEVSRSVMLVNGKLATDEQMDQVHAFFQNKGVGEL